MECIIAKIFGSEAMKEAAIELFMKTHGGRSFLKGHLFGDNVYDFLAPCIYEGEGEVLGMAFFKSLVKEHGRKFFEPIGKALQQARHEDAQPGQPGPRLEAAPRAGALRPLEDSANGSGRATARAYRAWTNGWRATCTSPWAGSPSCRAETTAAMEKHQLKLADRQCRIAELSQRIQDATTILVTALWGQRQKDEAAVAAADILCQDLRRKLTGERPSDRYFRDAGKLADVILSGGFETLAGVPRQEILMKYENKKE